MVFALDEELEKGVEDDFSLPRTIISSPKGQNGGGSSFLPLVRNDTTSHRQYLNVDPEPIPKQKNRRTSSSSHQIRGRRRRSSVLDKWSVQEPEFVRRVSIAGAGSLPKETPFLDVSNSSYKDCAVFEEDDEEEEDPIVGGDVRTGISREIRDFNPIRVLGQGAYGKVILVKDKQTNKLYAMKQLKKAEILISSTDTNSEAVGKIPETDDEDSEEIKRAKRIERTFAERTILSQLEHPNIVKLFYSFHDTSKLYLLLQYIPGGELFYHLKEYGTLEEDTVAFYAAEISCALKFLHDRGVVYRDLKPENCLLNQNGHLVLTDFGLSKSSLSTTDESSTENEGEDVNTLHSIIGTPEYCAPEILQGISYTANCDWYSLGCLLYDMLTGKPPYTGANHKVIANKIKNDKQGPKIPYYLSEGMKDILGALLKKDQSKRWDVDKYWREERSNNNNKKEKGKKKKTKERTSAFQSHFIFRKIDWKLLENGDIQNTTFGPIVPVITDWELAENFDSEFTSMSYEEEDFLHSLNSDKSPDAFQGFSFKASGSYLKKYF